MQYSSDGVSWTYESSKPFDCDKIAQMLRVPLGGVIYYREHEGAKVGQLQYGKRYGK